MNIDELTFSAKAGATKQNDSVKCNELQTEICVFIIHFRELEPCVGRPSMNDNVHFFLKTSQVFFVVSWMDEKKKRITLQVCISF